MDKKSYTVAEAAKTLRDMAQLTANASQNWDNYESIVRDMIQAAFDAGRASGG